MSRRNITPAEAAKNYMESIRWPLGVACVFCENRDRVSKRKGSDFYHCGACNKDWTVRSETVLSRSHVPLDKWLVAVERFISSSKKLTSVNLSKDLGVTQKTAWFMLSRLKSVCGEDRTKFKSVESVFNKIFES